MVKHQSKCLLEVTKSSSHNRSDRMIESSTNQTYHNQPPFYQKHMGTYCFNTHLDVFFLLTNAPLQFENRLLNTTMALSSKIKRATRMYILRRYHLPAVAMCAMKISISGHGCLHGEWGGNANEAAHWVQLGFKRGELSYIDENVNLSAAQSHSVFEKNWRSKFWETTSIQGVEM